MFQPCIPDSVPSHIMLMQMGGGMSQTLLLDKRRLFAWNVRFPYRKIPLSDENEWGSGGVARMLLTSD